MFTANNHDKVLFQFSTTNLVTGKKGYFTDNCFKIDVDYFVANKYIKNLSRTSIKRDNKSIKENINKMFF